MDRVLAEICVVLQYTVRKVKIILYPAQNGHEKRVKHYCNEIHFCYVMRVKGEQTQKNR